MRIWGRTILAFTLTQPASSPRKEGSLRRMAVGTPLAIWRSRHRTFHAEGAGLIPGWEPKIPRASQCSQEKEEEDGCLLRIWDSPALTLTAKNKPLLPTSAPIPTTHGGWFPILSLMALRAAHVEPFRMCKGSTTESHLPAALQLPEDSGQWYRPCTWQTSASTPVLSPCLLKNK